MPERVAKFLNNEARHNGGRHFDNAWELFQAVACFSRVSVGSVGFGAVLGILMLGEELMYQGWAGVAILMSGIALVATDPGEKMEGH